MTVTCPRRHRRLLGSAAFIAVSALLLAIGPVRPAGADAVSDKQAEAKAISDKLTELESRQMDLNAQYEQSSYALHQAEGRVDEAQRQADETQAELDHRRAELEDFSVRAYVQGNDGDAANAILTSDPGSGVEKKAYVETMSGNRQDLIDSLNAAKRKADEDQAALEAAKNTAEGQTKQIDKLRSQAAKATDEQRGLNDKAQGELATLVAQEQARRAAEATTTTTAAPAAPATTQTVPARPAQSDTAPTAPTAPTGPATPPPTKAPPPAGAGGSGAIAAGMTKMGAPYVWAAAGPSAFDCSGFTSWAYAQVGISLPHFSGAQYAMTTRISRSQLQPGDLVFWGPGGSDHVAIFIGGDSILHTFRNPEGVTITALDGWWKPPSGYGRIN